MRISIGMRTIKTAVGSAIAIMLAQFFNLASPTAAGIITLLSVTNTKRSSFETGLFRIASLALACAISFLCFTLIGYNAIAFGFYLLFFIPLAVKGKMSDGIPVSSVLVTHFLIAKEMTIGLLINAFLLLFIGVGIAWLANLFMPDVTKELKEGQNIIDDKIRQLLVGMSFYLSDKDTVVDCDNLLDKLKVALKQSETKARLHDENQLFSEDSYYLDYFTMRRLQVNILSKMNQVIKEIEVEDSRVVVTGVEQLLLKTASYFSEENDAKDLSKELTAVLVAYREADLPRTRDEFEHRGKLYQLLNEFERFLELKTTFSEKHPPRRL